MATEGFSAMMRVFGMGRRDRGGTGGLKRQFREAHYIEGPKMGWLGRWKRGVPEVDLRERPRTTKPLRWKSLRLFGEVQKGLGAVVGRLGDGAESALVEFFS